MIKPPTKLTIGEAVGQRAIIVGLNGTTNGRKVTGMVLIQQTGTPCVRVFQVAPN
jgi:hypothetical protein